MFCYDKQQNSRSNFESWKLKVWIYKYHVFFVDNYISHALELAVQITYIVILLTVDICKEWSTQKNCRLHVTVSSLSKHYRCDAFLNMQLTFCNTDTSTFSFVIQLFTSLSLRHSGAKLEFHSKLRGYSTRYKYQNHQHCSTQSKCKHLYREDFFFTLLLCWKKPQILQSGYRW